ncbi:hypothetical protein NQ315_011619 [Exocentrus adspersus]|uniref:Tubulin/FtsZ 2-layer sandwich domain-containing protein n=1 Tax=Exocentrus adspersus TaxID=1586481 RepID=A0AAV8VWZ9_9CUCU|nr:hypothetical protein NQ315_011619 [Exocentrus adspersus]
MGFATKELLENATCVFPIENRALLEIVGRQRNGIVKDFKSACPSFEDMNSIIVNMLLHVTSGSRFPGSLNFDMNELNTNMVPFPKLNFLCAGFNSSLYKSLKNGKRISKQVKDEVFLTSCSRINQMVKVDPLGPKSTLMGTTLIGRGSFTLTDMRGYVEKMQSKGRFTPWSSRAVKIGLCDTPPKGGSLAMLSVHNTSSMVNLFQHIQRQFTKLHKKKAHVHHYTKIPGFDADNFAQCSNSLGEIMDSYAEIENMSPINIPRLKAVKDFS